jgi:KilA-N domain
VSNLTVFNFKSNNIRFEQRGDRVWVNLTDMAKASGKLFADWNRLNSTTEFLQGLEGIMGIPIIQSNVGNLSETQRGTWAVEEVALEFAGWCSVQFKIWMLQQIKTLMTQGYVALPQVVQPVLPHRDATELYLTAKGIETINNLTLQQLLRDELIDELSIKRGLLRNLAPVKQPEHTIVKVRARELGYSTGDIGNGSALGKFVAKLVPVSFEERVGKYSVKHYLVSDQLDTAIKSYFGMITS